MKIIIETRGGVITQVYFDGHVDTVDILDWDDVEMSDEYAFSVLDDFEQQKTELKESW